MFCCFPGSRNVSSPFTATFNFSAYLESTETFPTQKTFTAVERSNSFKFERSESKNLSSIYIENLKSFISIHPVAGEVRDGVAGDAAVGGEVQ